MKEGEDGMLEHSSVPPVQVICDLRRYYHNVDTLPKMDVLWQELQPHLINTELHNGGHLKIHLAPGKRIILWVVDAQGQTRVQPETSFAIVDIVRNPHHIYRCRKCRAYGPFRCTDCSDAGLARGSERLCWKHANFIEGRWRAYCSEHVPTCRCFHACKERATFCCERCKGFFGAHYQVPHPHEEATYFCRRCYDRLFGQCSVCADEGKADSLGTLHCAFFSHEMVYPCEAALCWKHALQWKIWGPHSLGITFCEQHTRLIRKCDPADVLTIMLTARPPRRSKPWTLNNLYYLRRLLNQKRPEPLSFPQVVQSLRDLDEASKTWDKYAQRRYEEMVNVCNKTLKHIQEMQIDMLAQLRTFYEREVSPRAAQTISWLSIEDRLTRSNGGQFFKVRVYLLNDQKSPYIGLKGEKVKRIEAALGASLDFFDATVTPPRHLT